MKKKILISTFSILMLGTAACSQSKSTIVCNYKSKDGIVTTTNKLIHNEDELIEMNLKNELDLKKGNYDVDTEKEGAKVFKEKYDKIDNIDFDYKFKGDIYTMTLVVDVKDLSTADFKELVGLTTEPKKKDSFSAKEVKKHLESLSFTCKDE